MVAMRRRTGERGRGRTWQQGQGRPPVPLFLSAHRAILLQAVGSKCSFLLLQLAERCQVHCPTLLPEISCSAGR